jgi:hypothetical protein
MSSTLPDFLRETQSAVKSQMREGALYEELVFAGIVMDHMSEIGMTFEPVECHYEGTVGNAILRLSGYSISDDSDQLDLFVSLYAGVEEPTPIPDSETKVAAERCLRFLTLCAEGRMAQRLDQSSDVASLANTLQHIYNELEQVRVYVITDRVAKSKSFKTRDIGGKAVRLEVMDIERLHRHTSEGKPRDELVVNFNEVSGSPLPCVYVPGESDDYDYAMTAIPGEALRLLYEKFGARLLEANVRSFLSVKGKGVNAGIQATLRTAPERFMAYNNGIVIVADEMVLGKTTEGEQGIAWLKGLQIVNGGQTTASLYFTKKKYSRHGSEPRPCAREDHRHEGAGLHQGRSPGVGYLALRQQPERSPPVRPFGQQALPCRDRKAVSPSLLPRRRRPMVLRTRGRQLQHAARARGQYARPPQGIEGSHPPGAADY